VPTIFLHVEYYLANRHLSIEILRDAIEVEREGVKSKIAKSDIKEIVLFKSASTLTPMESYHFARIAANSEELVITNLITPDVEESLKVLGLGIQRKKGVVSSISLTKK
jgi:hypothetical protein